VQTPKLKINKNNLCDTSNALKELLWEPREISIKTEIWSARRLSRLGTKRF
jgi:hypothetical protein